MYQTTVETAVAVQNLWADPNRQLFKIPEVGLITGLSDSSVRRLVARGELVAILKLRHVLVTRASLERFVSAGGGK